MGMIQSPLEMKWVLSPQPQFSLASHSSGVRQSVRIPLGISEVSAQGGAVSQEPLQMPDQIPAA